MLQLNQLSYRSYIFFLHWSRTMPQIIPSIAPLLAITLTNLQLKDVAADMLFQDDTLQNNTLAVVTEKMFLPYSQTLHIWFEYQFDNEHDDLTTQLVTPYLNWARETLAADFIFDNTHLQYENEQSPLPAGVVCVFPLFEVNEKKMYIVFSNANLPVLPE